MHMRCYAIGQCAWSAHAHGRCMGNSLNHRGPDHSAPTMDQEGQSSGSLPCVLPVANWVAWISPKAARRASGYIATKCPN